jgi:hypothetical protein
MPARGGYLAVCATCTRPDRAHLRRGDRRLRIIWGAKVALALRLAWPRCQGDGQSSIAPSPASGRSPVLTQAVHGGTYKPAACLAARHPGGLARTMARLPPDGAAGSAVGRLRDLSRGQAGHSCRASASVPSSFTDLPAIRLQEYQRTDAPVTLHRRLLRACGHFSRLLVPAPPPSLRTWTVPCAPPGLRASKQPGSGDDLDQN